MSQPSQQAALSAGSTSAASGSTFTFPREYSFPPFFTIQPNLTTRHAQFTKWFALIRGYCAHHRIFRISASNPEASGAGPLFHNARLSRRLDAREIREVLAAMSKDENGALAEPVAPGDADAFWIWWRTPGDWANLLEGWIDETAQRGSVLTVYEILEGEATRGTGMLPFSDCVSVACCLDRVVWPAML